MIDLTQVLTFSEAALKWGFVDGNTLRKAVKRNRFKEEEVRKSGDIWLTTYQAMYRVFGQPRQSSQMIYYDNIFKLITDSVYSHKNIKKELDDIYMSIEKTIDNDEIVIIVGSENQPENIMAIIKTKDDLLMFYKPLERYSQSLSIYKDK